MCAAHDEKQLDQGFWLSPSPARLHAKDRAAANGETKGGPSKYEMNLCEKENEKVERGKQMKQNEEGRRRDVEEAEENLREAFRSYKHIYNEEASTNKTAGACNLSFLRCLARSLLRPHRVATTNRTKEGGSAPNGSAMAEPVQPKYSSSSSGLQELPNLLEEGATASAALEKTTTASRRTVRGGGQWRSGNGGGGCLLSSWPPEVGARKILSNAPRC